MGPPGAQPLWPSQETVAEALVYAFLNFDDFLMFTFLYSTWLALFSPFYFSLNLLLLATFNKTPILSLPTTQYITGTSILMLSNEMRW